MYAAYLLRIESQSHHPDLVSSYDEYSPSNRWPQHRRNPTILIWSVPTATRDVTQALQGAKGRNPTILIWSVPTYSEAAGMYEGVLKKSRNPTILIWSVPTFHELSCYGVAEKVAIPPS
jgi:hypothetical protein